MADFPNIPSCILNELSIETVESLPNFDFDFISDDDLLSAEKAENKMNPTSTEDKKTLDQNEVETFIKESKNSNTVKKTKTDLNVWKRWCESIEEKRAMEDIPPDELCNILAHFFMKAKKLNGEEFEPCTLTSFQRSFDRHLRDMGKSYSILTDKAFSKSRVTLEAKRKQLRLAGKGGHPNKALGLNKDEIEKLWREKQLGDHSPDGLVRTVWLNNTMHFGWRARDEHRKVLLGDLECRVEEGGKQEYVIWHTERGSKTRDGGKENSSERYFSPKMYATGGARCPVKMFKTYLWRRPQDMMKATDPFYLTPLQNPSGQKWFKRMPLGVHSLGNFMKNMAQAVNLPGKHTNHSARRTMITTLRHENISALDISQLSGHKNIKSIDSYSEASEEQQRKMSLLISKHSSGKERLPATKTSSDASSTASASSATTSFSGAVFNNCTIVLSQPKSPLPSKRRRYIIESDDDEE